MCHMLFDAHTFHVCYLGQHRYHETANSATNRAEAVDVQRDLQAQRSANNGLHGHGITAEPIECIDMICVALADSA